MLNLSDNDLDRLSREAAEHFTPDDTESSWEKLSAILDREIGKEPPISVVRYRFSPIVFAILILLLIGGGIAIWSSNGKKNPEITRQNEHSSQSAPAPANR